MINKKSIRINKKASTLFVLFGYIALSITILGFMYDLCRVLYYKTYLKNLSTAIALSVTNRCHYLNTYTDESAKHRVGVIIMNSDMREMIIQQYHSGSNNNNGVYDSDSNQSDMIKSVFDYYLQLESPSVNYHTSLADTTGIPFSNTIATTDKPTYSNILAYETAGNFNVVFAGQEYLQELLNLQKFNNQNKNMTIKNTSGAPTNWESEFVLSKNESKINRNLSASNQGMTQDFVNLYVSAYGRQNIINNYGSVSNLNRYIHGKDGTNGEVEIYLKGYVKHFFLGQTKSYQ